MSRPPRNPSRDAAVDWLMGRINYERASVIPYSEQTLKLDRIRELLRRLGDPHELLRIVHIAGTKGKGSTGVMIAAACQAAGLSVGFYSSPHMNRLEERFAINGVPCTADELVALVELVRPIAEAMDDEPIRGPTFFDLTTAIALAHFERRAVDAVVLEVGLGGRLDSTNVVTPAVSVITSISLDHTKQLGATRDLIAAEKAGIIKPGVPVVSGVTDAEAGDVIARLANERGSRLRLSGRDFTLQGDRFTRTAADGTEESIDNVVPALPGEAQARNAAVALATLGVLADEGWELPIEARREGIATGRLPGRMERFEGDPLVIIDGAHNEASAEALADALDSLCSPASRERRVLVVAISNDKSPGAILKPLARRFSCVVGTRFLDNPRALPPSDLATAIKRIDDNVPVITASTPSEALTVARERAGVGGAVVCTGSLLFAAEARRVMRDEGEGSDRDEHSL
ncbi:MAG: folylpolyglutamate synthase/dihydrofolate synthase family protein [Planctomycetota bacterium]